MTILNFMFESISELHKSATRLQYVAIKLDYEMKWFICLVEWKHHLSIKYKKPYEHFRMVHFYCVGTFGFFQKSVMITPTTKTAVAK